MADTEALASFAGPETEPETESYKQALRVLSINSSIRNELEERNNSPKATARKSAPVSQQLHAAAAVGEREARRFFSPGTGVNRSDRDCESTAASQLGEKLIPIMIPKRFTTRPEVNEGNRKDDNTVSSNRPDTRQKLKWQTMGCQPQD